MAGKVFLFVCPPGLDSAPTGIETNERKEENAAWDGEDFWGMGGGGGCE